MEDKRHKKFCTNDCFFFTIPVKPVDPKKMQNDYGVNRAAPDMPQYDLRRQNNISYRILNS